jgi:DNA-binding MarR family transcriptional regulator
MRANTGCRSVLEAVRMFQVLRPGARLTDITSFLIVCDNEGLSVKELAYLSGASAATISRSIKYLAQPGECNATADSLCLLRLSRHPQDGRLRGVFLTDDGRNLERDIRALFSPHGATSDGATSDGATA